MGTYNYDCMYVTYLFLLDESLQRLWVIPPDQHVQWPSLPDLCLRSLLTRRHSNRVKLFRELEPTEVERLAVEWGLGTRLVHSGVSWNETTNRGLGMRLATINNSL